MIHAIGYVRRSTDKQDLSLEQQRQKLEQFAAARGWTLTRVFDDDAISGSDMKRPGLERMMAFARSSTDVGVVIAWERNRLARPKDPLDGLMLERELMSAGKRVVYAATGQEADRSFSSGLISYVEHFQSGDYLRKLSRDTMRGLVHRAEMGLWTGGPIPYGFDRLVIAADGTPKRIVRDLPDRTQVLLDVASGNVMEHVADGNRYSKQDFERCTLIPSEPERVLALQRLFADYAAGSPIRVLRDQLNRAGMRTARGRIFTAATIHAMLENPAYVGRCVYNRRTESKWHRHSDGRSVERLDEGLERRPESDWIIKHDAWPALVDADTFERVQARRRSSKQKHAHVVGTAIRSPYLLTGIAFCGVCGGLLSGQTTTSGKGYRTRYYVCATHHRGDHVACPRRFKVPAAAVEDHIIALIRQDLMQLRDDDQLHRYVQQELARVTGGRQGQSDRLQRRMADLDQQLAKLRDHLKALDPQTAASLGLYDEAKTIADERAEIERELAVESVALPSLPAAESLRANASGAFDQLGKVLAGGTSEMANTRLDYNDVSLIRAFAVLAKECEEKVEQLVEPLVEVMEKSGIGSGKVGRTSSLFKGMRNANVSRELGHDSTVYAGIGGDSETGQDFLSVWMETHGKHPQKPAFRAALKAAEAELRGRNPKWRMASQAAQSGWADWLDLELTVTLATLLIAEDQQIAVVTFVQDALNDLKETGIIDAFNRTIGSSVTGKRR